MDFHKFSWICIYLHRFPWISNDFHTVSSIRTGQVRKWCETHVINTANNQKQISLLGGGGVGGGHHHDERFAKH